MAALSQIRTILSLLRLPFQRNGPSQHLKNNTCTMRLINARTLEFEEFYGVDIPKYAILSHTWGHDEVTFQEWSRDRKKAAKKGGCAKIEKTCQLALQSGLEYAWVDTCCIDKRSSAELSEAINSMFAWYGAAEVCFAFLVDVERNAGDYPRRGFPESFRESFQKSRWFTRGWTLQELLAPRKVIFYSGDWFPLGEKKSRLKRLISDTTGIDDEYLSGSTPITKASIALRMFWLSQRKTTRVEDMAYCMLGIFDINMPLLYGEGAKAFVRLQEEIIKVSVDHTIFCWSWIETVSPDWASLIAPSPDTFKHSRDFSSSLDQERPYAMTNKGLSIRLPIIQAWSFIFVILMAHHRRASEHRLRVCIPIRNVSWTHDLDFPDTYRRIPFPAFPLFMPEDWALPRIDMFIQSKSLPVFNHTLSSQRTTEPQSLLITLGESHSQNPFSALLSDTASATPLTDLYDGGRFRLETYPPKLFDETRSIFRLDNRIAIGGNGLLLLGNREFGCVLFISCKFDESKRLRTRWVCHILPPSFWGDTEVERAELLRHLEIQIQGMKEDCEVEVAVCKEIGGYFVIDKPREKDDYRYFGIDRELERENVDKEGGREIMVARLELGLGKEKIEKLSREMGYSQRFKNPLL